MGDKDMFLGDTISKINFKLGEFIVYIGEGSGNSQLTKLKIYEVIQVESDRFHIVLDTGDKQWMFADSPYFITLKDFQANNKRTFKGLLTSESTTLNVTFVENSETVKIGCQTIKYSDIRKLLNQIDEFRK